ncbi:MAG: hypothetical protein ABEI06_01755 [Halobacteriaceae archaeon]
MIRQVLFVIGFVAALAGIAIIFVPSIAIGFSVDKLLVYGLGLLALLLAGGGIQRRRKNRYIETETGEPETPISLPRPGSEIDSLLEEIDKTGGFNKGPERESLEKRLRELAIRIIQRNYECTRDQAREMLEQGTWTTNEYAAAFFNPELKAEITIRRRVSLSLGSQTVSGYLAREAIKELDDLSGQV